MRTVMNHYGERRKLMATEVVVKEWLTYPEAQQYASLGRTKLWELVSAGEVKAARVGRAVRISRRSLDQFMQRMASEEAVGQ
jgi:excisionase family DNA binding protein